MSGLLVNRRGEEVEKAALNTDAITFDEFLSGEFSAKFFNGSWWSDTELQWKDQVSLSYKFFKNAAPIKKNIQRKRKFKGD
jgi:hypothetical protein